MSRQILAIGDTGAQLVSKFNSNFTELYNYNVEDYGAVHDGVTDDTEAIQDAINACFNGGGGVVYFPNGTYCLSGALKNGIGGIDYNSQLYIPYAAWSVNNVEIKLIGESFNWINTNDDIGVIWKSTIAGSGTWPSVICSKGSGPYLLNYTGLTIENIKINVEAFKDTTGASMSCFNLMYASTPYVNNISASCGVLHKNTKKPDTDVFGLAMGIKQSDFGRIGFYVCLFGFTYGLMIGEGIHANNVQIYGCEQGVIGLTNNYGSLIDYLVVHWCKYPLSGQLDTIFEQARTVPSKLIINLITSEKGEAEDSHETPEWCWEDQFIHDHYHCLLGYANYQRTAGHFTKTSDSGGYNFMLRDIGNGSSFFDWTTTSRPFPIPEGIMGYNAATHKLEYYNGADWIELV